MLLLLLIDYYQFVHSFLNRSIDIIMEKLRGFRYETIEEIKEAVTKVIDTRGLPLSLPEVVGMVQQVHYSRRRLLQNVCTINKKSLEKKKKVWKLIEGPSYREKIFKKVSQSKEVNKKIEKKKKVWKLIEGPSYREKIFKKVSQSKEVNKNENRRYNVSVSINHHQDNFSTLSDHFPLFTPIYKCFIHFFQIWMNRRADWVL